MTRIQRQLENIFNTGLSRREIETVTESIIERLEACEDDRRADLIAEYELFHIFD